MNDSDAASFGNSPSGKDRLSELKPLVFLSPEVLFELLDRQERGEDVVIIEPAAETPTEGPAENGTALNIRTAQAKDADDAAYTRMEQDGITLYISPSIRPTPQQQLNVELKRGWLRNKLTAYIAGKQQVPGFMGTRDCS
ncbi:MAG: hypothetical protein ACOC2C_06360 [Cyclonatronaceae bacterium]